MKNQDFDRYINSLSKEEIEKNNQRIIEESDKEYKLFSENFRNEKCYICNQSIYNFSKNKVCLHNLLRLNNKFKKKHFQDIYKKWGYFNIQSYLRWCANYENQGNINDLNAEKGKNKKFEITIIWKNIEWTFSCSESDFLGHKGKNSDFPHYHFQMRIDQKIFIKFSDFHIGFSEEDLLNFEMMNSFKFRYTWNYGIGIQDKLNLIEEFPDEVISEMKYSNKEDGDIRLGTFITGNINGDEIAEIMNEAKKTGKTMAYLIQEKYKNNDNMNVKTTISPNDSIPNIAAREGGKGNTK